MGLSKEDFKKIPKDLDEKTCYKRIRRWVMDNGLNYLERSVSKTRYYFLENLIKKIPDFKNSSSDDRDYLFASVIAGNLEWSYHQIDSKNIKMAAYAKLARKIKYGKDKYSDLYKNAKKSFMNSIEDRILKNIREILKEYEPSKLRIWIKWSNRRKNSFTLNFKNERLIIHEFDINGDSIGYFSPWVDDWKSFWEELNDIKIWDWKEKYEMIEFDSDVSRWEIELEYKEKKVVSKYPKRTDDFVKIDFKEFDRFLSAVLKLYDIR
jgi:hypothetical protein